MQSAVNEIAMKPFEMQREKDSWRVPLVSTNHPVLKNIKSILRMNLPIIYAYKRTADLLKEQPTKFIQTFKELKYDSEG